MGELSRRRFLQIAGGVALGTVAAQIGLLRLAPAWAAGKSVSRTTGRWRRAVPSTCLQCPARCGILGFVEEGYLVKIEGNPADPNSKGRLCAKGLAGINHLYNPDRLLYPMKRVGARGAGAWKRITWDEAMGELSRRLQDIHRRGRPEELVFIAGLLEGITGLHGRFMQAYGTPRIYSEMSLFQANKQVAQQLTWGAEFEVSDLARTRFILNFGSNPYESHPMYLPLARRLVQAQRRGARLVTLDPRLSNTASRSDHWLAIQPGTDAIVALALARVIVDRGLASKEFMARWSNYPLDFLSRHLSYYSVEQAAQVSGIPAEELEALAMELATSGPATLIAGDGLSQHVNGVQNERSVSLLAALTGNVDTPGGYCLPRRYTLPEPEPHPPELSAPPNMHRLLSDLREGRVSLLLTYMANPVYTSPSPSAMQEALKDERLIPFFVATDSYLTETAMLADLVLPAAIYLESYDLQSPPAYDLVSYVSLMQPVVPPQGECRPFGDVLLELARRIGGDLSKYMAFGSVEGYLQARAESLPDLKKAGGWELLKAKGVWYDQGASPSFYTYKRDGFSTPSRQFEVYSRGLEAQGQPPVPIYQPLPQHPSADLHLITFQYNVHTYGRTAPCMWLSEIVHDNPVWINRETARERKIQTGDLVRLASPAGTVVARARVTSAIWPGVLAMGACAGHWASGRIAQAQSFESADPNTKLLWWQEHGNGSHPYHLFPPLADPVGGGPGWKDGIVTVTKV